MIYGYARVSDKTQNLDTQIEQLKAYGVDQIMSEKISGIAKERKLNDLISHLNEGDSLVVTRLDRLGRSTIQLLQLIEELEQKNVRFVAINFNIDTKGPLGKPLLAV